MPETAPVVSPKVLKDLQRLKDKLGPPPLWTLKDRHALGSALLRACKREGPGHGGRYGVRLMGQIAEALGMDEGVLNKHRQFAESIGEDEADRLDGIRLKNGEPLAWSHARVLMEVGDEKKRSHLADRAAAGNWSSARLGAAIRDIKKGKKRGGGPKPTEPVDLLDLVHQMDQMLSEWEARHDKVWSAQQHSLPGLAGKMVGRHARKQAGEKLATLREAWSRAVDRSQSMVKDVDLAIERLGGKGSGTVSEA